MSRWLEPLLAALLTLTGMVLTTVGAFVHLATVVAPGALFILAGGAWLGNAMARQR